MSTNLVLFSGSTEFTCAIPLDYSASATIRDLLSDDQQSNLDQHTDLVLYSINYDEFGTYDDGYEVTKVFTMDSRIEDLLEHNNGDLVIKFGDKVKVHIAYTDNEESHKIVACTGTTVEDILVTYSNDFLECSVRVNGTALDNKSALLSNFVDQGDNVSITISDNASW
ncbi:hypothetical protein EV183_005585 [Coemansia sp. RSA 2336]|nr:hypothetical protein EV183_005585 [Coemansia sp. RSA 2336]